MSQDLVLVAISLMTWGLGEGMFLFFQPLYLHELGADPLLIGGVLGLTGLAAALAHLPAGYLSDRIGRRPLLLAAWITGTLTAWIMASSRTLPVFVFGSVLYGMTAFVISPLNSYVTAARGNWSVGRAITFISAMYNIGAVAGPLIGGWIGSRLGLHANFMVAACVFIPSTLVLFFIRPQPIERPAVEEKQNVFRNVLNTRYVKFLMVIFIVMFCMYLPQPLSQNFLHDQRGVNLAQMGLLLATRSIGVILLNLVLGRLNARVGFLLSQVAMALFTLLLWRGSGLTSYLLAYLLLGSYQTARALATAQGRHLVQSSNMGLGYGMIETVSSFAVILAPPLAGFLYQQNPVWIYSISLVLIVLACIFSLFFSPLRAGDFKPTEREKIEWVQS